MMKKLLFILTISLLIPVFAFSQSPNPSATPPVKDDEDVVKISTTLIQVDATVLDKNGNIVKGLTADDFEIYENGKQQPITNFSFVGIKPDSLTNSTAPIAVRPNKNAIPVPPMPTNLRPEQIHRTVALVVDDLDISFGSVSAVKSALKKFVDEQMQPDDLVAIIRTGGGGGFLQQFTFDKRILYAAIEKVRWNPAGSGKLNAFQTADESDTNADATSAAGRATIENSDKFNSYREDVFAVGTLGAVNYIVKGMRELPGRKAIVLFSEGFELYTQDKYDASSGKVKSPNTRLTAGIQHLVDLANRSSVIIYGIDTRGLIVPMPGADDGVRAGDSGKFGQNVGKDAEEVASDRIDLLFETQQGLKYLSEQTGGFAVINNNNLGKGIEQVLNDQQGYYLLGYQPDSESFDPKKARFNELLVKLKRPDLRVRYRSGYFGIQDADIKSAAKTPQQQIIAALTSPFNAGNINLQLTSLFANDAQTGDFMRSLVYVNGKDLNFTEEADGWQKATFDVVAMVFGENGTVTNEVSRTETIKARAETLQEIREKGFVSTITVPIKKPGAYQMRVVIRDTTTARIGSVNQFIEVPDLKKSRLTLSGILLQRSAAQPVEYKNVVAVKQFQPDEQRDVATRSFRAGMNVRFGYAVYNAKPNKNAPSPNLTMQFRVFRDNREVFSSKEKPVNFLEQTDTQRLLAEGIFTLGRTIQPGNYVLQVIVRDSSANGKNRIATQWIDFEVGE